MGGLKQSWPRRPLVARWVHDVLVIHRGLALVRTDLLGVSRAIGTIEAADAKRLRRLGANPCTLTLVLDGGASVQLGASADDRDTMVGPFAAVLFIQGDEGAGPPHPGDLALARLLPALLEELALQEEGGTDVVGVPLEPARVPLPVGAMHRRPAHEVAARSLLAFADHREQRAVRD